jgi:uncharacterized protein
MADQKPIALVTGGSSGIGYELAREFATNGFDVIIVAHRQGRLIEAQQSLRSATGARIEAISADLSEPEGVRRLHEQASSIGPIDTLVLNAGHGAYGEFATDTSLEDELDLIALNVTSVVHLAKLGIKDMLGRGHGRILLTGSIAGTSPGPLQAVYHASKAFVNSFGEALHQELKDKGIVVTVLMPGATQTDFFTRAHGEDARVAQGKLDDPADVAATGFKALMAGHDHVVHGLMNKAQVAMTKVTPTSTAAKMTGNQNKPV